MGRLFRVQLGLVLVLAAILAVEPPLHQHSLIPGADSDGGRSQLCALCVAGPARIVSLAPSIAIPIAVAFVPVEVRPIAPSIDARGPVPSRAPPIA